MKKLLLLAALFITIMVSAQSFTKKYDYYIKIDRIANTISELESINLTVIFSGNDKGDIIMYFDSGYNVHVDRFYKTGKIYEGISKEGLTFRYIETRNERKEKVIIQLFDMGVFRAHTQDATYEYQPSLD